MSHLVLAVAPCDPDHCLMPSNSSIVRSGMGGFSILTNRKRAIIALVHSVVFLLIAVRQMVAAQPSEGIWVASTVSRGTWILCGIFAIVSAILLWLFVISADRWKNSISDSAPSAPPQASSESPPATKPFTPASTSGWSCW